MGLGKAVYSVSIDDGMEGEDGLWYFSDKPMSLGWIDQDGKRGESVSLSQRKKE